MQKNKIRINKFNNNSNTSSSSNNNNKKILRFCIRN